MLTIKINGNTYEVNAGRNLLQASLSLGFDIPYFCYHPALGSVGACRLCAVKKFANADDKAGKIVMSCMEPVSEGLIISTDDEEIKEFRAGVIEGLMTNHPHDCPICDEGGECHLQDMTVMTGHNYRRYEFKKRTYVNQYLGPFIQHEMNRCIQCYRCVRFYRDYAGGKDLNVYGAANHVYFGRHREGLLESEFSGNLVEVCPTGVFTDKTLKRHFSRKWDLTNSPSLCVHCSLGCNTLLSERYGEVRRTMSRYNGSINGYFLCDRGRYGYEFINSAERIKKIFIRTGKSAGAEEVKDISRLSALPPHGKIMGIGSPRASLEANFALSSLVGPENFYHGISGREQKLVKKALGLLTESGMQIPSLKEIEKCDAVFILGEDITNTAPMLALAVRQAIRNKSIGTAEKMGIPKWNDVAVRNLNHQTRSPLFIASPYSTKLDELAEETLYASPEDIARLGFTVASALHAEAPVISPPDKPLQKTATRISDALLKAENPLIIAGISGGSMDILNAVDNIAASFSRLGKKPGLTLVFPESNSVGLGLTDGKHLDDAFERINKDPAETLIILENDLYRRSSKENAEAAFEKCRQVIVIDHLMNETAMKADVLLPAATYAESAGTIVNNEGRAQRYYPVLPVNAPVKESWNWIIDLMKLAGKDQEIKWEKFDDVVASLAKMYPVFSGIREHMPDADFRFFNEKIARQTMRFSGRTAMNASVSVSEPKPPADLDSPLEFSMEGYKGKPPSTLVPYYWSPGWNSPQSINKYLDEPGGTLKDRTPGVMIFDKKENLKPGFGNIFPDPFRAKKDELFFIPVYRIFGSEELSSHGQAIAELIPEPFVLLNEKESKKLNINENENYKFSINQVVISARVKTDTHIPDGLAGLSGLLPGMSYTAIPDWGKIVPSGTDKR